MNNKTLQEIPIGEISPNPHNPRLFFNEDDLEDLKESISKVGVLVPITVYENTRHPHLKKFILLDGERRYRSCQKLELLTIKANIIDEPEDITQNIMYMFNIHFFKREWEIFPTALKLEVLINSLGTSKESVLSSSTGLRPQMIRDCKKLLWYPKKYRDILLDRDPKISTAFFIELYPIVYRLTQESEFMSQSRIEEVVDCFITKIKNSTFVDVKELRQIKRYYSYFDNRGDNIEIINKTKHFLNTNAKPIDFFKIKDDGIEDQKNELLREISSLLSLLTSLNMQILSDSLVIDQMKTLNNKLSNTLDMLQG